MTADTLMREPVLVVTQRGWLTTDYGIFDEHGHQLAGVRHGKQGMIGRQLEIIDQQGATLLRLVRPVQVFGWHLAVTRPDGAVVGRFIARPALGGLRLVIQSRGETLGELRPDSRTRFAITDPTHQVVARIERQRDGQASCRYILRIHGPVPDPLRSLLIAAPLAVEIRRKELGAPVTG
ncbi:MAG: hypothetical protein ACRD0K_28890 [Egibacteraceae bacterium]